MPLAGKMVRKSAVLILCCRSRLHKEEEGGYSVEWLPLLAHVGAKMELDD